MSTTAVLRDTNTVLTRELKPLLGDPFSVVFSIIQPLFFLALFGPLLAGVGVGDEGSLQWFVPGILVMSALFATSTTGANLLMEIQTGSHERMLVTPVGRSALLLGRAGKEIVPMIAQSIVVLAVVTPFSFVLHPGGAVVGMVILSAFAVGLGSLSYSLALAVRENDWVFWMVQQTLIFPLLLLSGMLLPLDGGPGWLRALSDGNPLKYIVDAERSLFSGSADAATVAYGAIAAGAVAVVGLYVGTRMMRRAAA